MALIPSPPPDASATKRGLVSLLAQSFAGVKTFLAGVVAAGVNPLVTNSSTLGTSLLRWAAVHTHAVTFADGSVQTTKGETASLASAGTGASLVKTGAGPALAVKSLAPGTGISLNPVGDTVEIAATMTVKPLTGTPNGVAVTETASEINLSLPLVINVDAVAGRSPGAWIFIGGNLDTTGRVTLGAAGVLAHVLGTLVVEGGQIRSGPNDGQQRVLNHGPNTRVQLKGGGGGYAVQTGFTDANAGVDAAYVLDAAARYVRITGYLGQFTAGVLDATATAAVNLPTAIRPPSGRNYLGHLYTSGENEVGFVRVRDGTLYVHARTAIGANRAIHVDIGFFLA